MSDLKFQRIEKKFGTFTAVEPADLTFEHGKLTALLGPSGCGKTTVLRMIAGLEAPTSGCLTLDGHDITSDSAEKRKFGMVFQSFALFPHLSVAQNISYSLRIAGACKDRQATRAQELLELVQLGDKGNRRIGELSGGQRQRVAIARALAQDPEVFLLDEPMSALDAQLRGDMQMELRQLQRSLGITTIVVTHDQREAMTMADKIVVMSNGRVEQVGTPQEIYHKPANGFVASFIGNAVLLDAVVDNDGVRVGSSHFRLSDMGSFQPGNAVTLFCRPEAVVLTGDVTGPNSVSGVVTFVRDEGVIREIHLDTTVGPITAEIPGSFEETVNIGDKLAARLPEAVLHLLPPRQQDAAA